MLILKRRCGLLRICLGTLEGALTFDIAHMDVGTMLVSLYKNSIHKLSLRLSIPFISALGIVLQRDNEHVVCATSVVQLRLEEL